MKKNYLLSTLVVGCLFLSGCWQKDTPAPETESNQEPTMLEVIEEIQEILTPEEKTEPSELSDETPAQEDTNNEKDSLNAVLEEIQEIITPESKTQEFKSHKLEDLAEGTTAEAAFRDVVKEDNVLVDFFATWCPPCQAMHPVLDKLAMQEHAIKVVKVDVDKFKSIAQHFEVGDGTINVKGLPSFYLFKDGKLINSFTGASGYDQFKQKVAKLFGLE